MRNIWQLNSGTNLGTIEEGRTVNFTLPTVGLITGITFSVISGKLPGGLRIVENRIIGTTQEVSRPTTFTFVIRARGTENGLPFISDRTFAFDVEGYDEPVWLTPEGSLRLTSNNLAFVLDGTQVDFQLSAIDNDLPTGENLEYFVGQDDGELPKGLSLTEDGRIVGFVDPIYALDIASGTGYFDSNLFDSNFFDFGLPPATGMDTYLYDSVVYDYFDSIRNPKKLNRYFEFRVSVSDGETIVKRVFKIYVVGDDFLRSDNTIMKAGTGVFTADNTYLRSPIWLTPGNLGIKRANNFVTVFLDVFDPIPTQGPVVYQLEKLNDDLSISDMPPGMFLDSTNGELFGFVPYQPAVTKEYKFTVSAIKFDKESITEVSIVVALAEAAFAGQKYLTIYPLLSQNDIDRIVRNSIRIGFFNYKVIGYQAPNTVENPHPQFARLILASSVLFPIPLRDRNGNLTTIIKTYYESTLAFNTKKATKTFVVSVIGEVDSVIKYITPKEVGNITANFPSTFSVVAETSVPRAVLNYKIISGSLPPGLSITASGEIIGKVRQFSSSTEPGLTTLDTAQTTFDGKTTTFDRVFKFTVTAADQFEYSAITSDFVITVDDPDKRLYSNIFVQPFQKTSIRQQFYEFISNSEVFPLERIYRPNDPSFGVQFDLKMLVYAGIETTTVENYITALQTNASRKRFKIGSPKIAIARNQGSLSTVYEVIYLEVIDTYENKQSVSRVIKRPTNNKVPVLINQKNKDTYFGNPTIANDVSKFGEGSIFFNGTNSGLKVISELTDFKGVGDFTYEGWMYFNSVNTIQALFDLRGINVDAASINLFLKDGTIQLYQNGWKELGNSLVLENTWYHFSLVRQGTTYKLYKDGVLQGTAFGAGGRLLCNKFNIGISQDNISYPFAGYMEEIRVSNVARYTNNFSVQPEPFVDDDNSVLLIKAGGSVGSTRFVDFTQFTRKPKTIIASGDINRYPVWEGRLDYVTNESFNPSTTPLTADLTSVNISGSDIENIYPTSITNIRENIKNITIPESGISRQLVTEREFLPLWMVTPQDRRTPATGFIKAIPICYCLPGEASYILDNIENAGFDFSVIDYEIDRLIIDSTAGSSESQYLKFRNFKYNV